MTPQKRQHLARLARHDVVSLAELRAAGFTKESVRHLIRCQSLFPQYRGVLALRDRLSAEGSILAAVLACGPGAVASHYCALWLWGLIDEFFGAPDVTIPTATHRRGPEGVTVHRSPSVRQDSTVHRDIPITSIKRTLIDTAPRLQPFTLKAAVRAAERDHGVDLAWLRREVNEPRTAAGPAALRRCLDEFVVGEELTEEELELRFMAMCVNYSLPLPEPQVWFGTIHRADFVWEAFKLIVETDGRRWHSGYVAASVDHAKDRALRAAGYEVMRFTWADIVNRPAETAREIRAAMRRRARELAR